MEAPDNELLVTIAIKVLVSMTRTLLTREAHAQHELSWVVARSMGFMQMRYACGLNKISCFKGLNYKIQVKEDSATENENIKNRKIDEQYKFSLDAEFVWILQKP